MAHCYDVRHAIHVRWRHKIIWLSILVNANTKNFTGRIYVMIIKLRVLLQTFTHGMGRFQ